MKNFLHSVDNLWIFCRQLVMDGQWPSYPDRCKSGAFCIVAQQVTSIEHVRRWVACRLRSTRHERRVMHLADGIYSLLQPIHQLSPRHRRMLRIGALLHDVGRHPGSRRHHVRGARVIAKAQRLKVTPAERAFGEYAARFHRGAIPTGRDNARRFRPEHRRPMRILLAILRAADALDKRRLATPTIMLKRDGYQLVITVIAPPEHHETLGTRRKFRMLRDELDISVKVKLRSQ